MIGISDKQGEMLAFIEDFVAKHGYPPTREEIRAGLNISTKSLVNYHLEALENAALLKRIPNTSRGLQLTRVASGDNSEPGNQMFDLLTEESPILEPDEVLELTFGAVANNNNLYALKVESGLLLDDRLDEGDIVILQRQAQAQNGEVVAVKLLDCGKTTFKQYYRENGHVRLETDKMDTRPLIVSPGAVEIQGKVVAIIRQVEGD